MKEMSATAPAKTKAVYYRVIGGAGVMAVASGLIDGTVGIAYLIGLPRRLQCQVGDLLFDRR